jgi:ribosomal protein S24E
MPEPIAWLDGRLVPLSEAKLSVFDLGVVLGASITEMIRTFGHRPFRLDDHLGRMFRSLRAVGFGTDLSRDELESAALRVVEHNAKLIPESHDLGIVMFVTAGKNLTYLGLAGLEESRTRSVCVHTFPLPFELLIEALPAVCECLPDGDKTPGRDRVKSELAKAVGAKPELTVIDHMDSEFGRGATRGFAKVYASVEKARHHERNYIQKRNKILGIGRHGGLDLVYDD